MNYLFCKTVSCKTYYNFKYIFLKNIAKNAIKILEINKKNLNKKVKYANHWMQTIYKSYPINIKQSPIITKEMIVDY